MKRAAFLLLLALGLSSCDGMFFSPENPQERYNAEQDYESNSLHEKLSNEPSGY